MKKTIKKIRRKAFTLIELLAIILILAAVALIAAPIVTNVTERSKQKAYNQIVSNIEKSASNYSIYHELGYSKLYSALPLSTLKETGYLENTSIIDPRNNEEMDGCVLYKWNQDEEQYNFIYSEECDVESVYPDITINVLNGESINYALEKLRFEVLGEYDSYKYCIGNNCNPNIPYTGTTIVTEEGEDIYICVEGYMETEAGRNTCVGPYKVDTSTPKATIKDIATTTSRIVVTYNCSDEQSKINNYATDYNKRNSQTIIGQNTVTEIEEYEYEQTDTYTNLESGTFYVLNLSCENYAGVTGIASEVVQTKVMTAPTIAQVSQTVEGTTYALSRTIRITYYGTNISSPKYYYSLDGTNWTQVTNATTKDLTFTSNGYVYAKTVDEAGNIASASTYTVTNIDTTGPNVSVSASSIKTDRVTLTANCTDPESGIITYQFSRDGGALWQDNGTNPVYTYDSLTQNTTYNFMALCRNGSLLSNSDTVSAKTTTIQNPTINLVTQYPSGTTYAQAIAVRITYYGNGIENPKYYYSLDNVNWTEHTDSTTKDITFTANGNLYAKTVDSKGNLATSATYTITNIDTTAPSTSLIVSNVEADSITLTANCTDPESGIITYQFSRDGGALWQDNGTNPVYTYDSLTQNTTYNFIVLCRNGSLLSNTSTASGTTLSAHTYPINYVWNYDYTGGIQSFTVPESGTYKLEVWGAQGGGDDPDTNYGGKGGKISGNVVLSQGTTLYIGVGGKGDTKRGVSGNVNGGYNGGSIGHCYGNDDDSYDLGGGGGGATHIALNTNRGVLSNYDSYRSEILIVAGGGGGGCGWSSGGRWYGTDGGFIGESTTTIFGQGGSIGEAYNNGGGGGGYYGGAAGPWNGQSGKGGSSYYSDNISSPDYSSGVRSGNGYAKITLISY